MSMSSSKNPATVADLLDAFELTAEQREKADAFARAALEFVGNLLRAAEQLARPALSWLATELEKDPDFLDNARAALEYGKQPVYIAAPSREPAPAPTPIPVLHDVDDDDGHDDDDYN